MRSEPGDCRGWGGPAVCMTRGIPDLQPHPSSSRGDRSVSRHCRVALRVPPPPATSEAPEVCRSQVVHHLPSSCSVSEYLGGGSGHCELDCSLLLFSPVRFVSFNDLNQTDFVSLIFSIIFIFSVSLITLLVLIISFLLLTLL